MKMTEVFQRCHNLTNVVLSNNITRICSSMFRNCFNLPTIVIPAKVVVIEDYAFYNCRSLTNITIPASVNIIKGGAFAECSSLSQINFEGTKVSWQYIRKEFGWNADLGKVSVHCVDGEIQTEAGDSPSL